jgi:hypothetical protein
MGPPRPGDCWSLYAVRTNFRPEAAKGVHETYELRFDDDAAVALYVRDGELDTHQGNAVDPDFVAEVDPCVMAELIEGERSVSDAIGAGAARILHGDESAFERLVGMFSRAPDRASAAA